ncbi:LysR family transcriptional regulator [Neogemmobacter tilapiae]|uniref:LysR family transcriptional regulator n=1 Tax=Neogemmobacter tilapiae TaxID=875041 RepID=A0A918WGR4_9RHOB|nr:LysR family transcriptional regulator [Gemmobacter tilapiae]GHC46112.1 LysR family transcriptional regulator [Gemmobacter tilapiae]
MNQDWNLYRSYLAVMTHGSLSGAARDLGLTQPTLARHIDQLEQVLGLGLFLRGPSGLSPTEAGLALRPAAQAIEAAALAFERAAEGAGQKGAAGVVRISASEVFAAERLPALLRDIRQQYPQITLEIVATDHVEDLLRRDSDIALRMTAPEQQALIARRLGSVRLGLFAHPDYLARRGHPQTPKDLADHDLIGYDRWTPALRRMLAEIPALTRESFALRVDHPLVQLAALRAGFGLGICQVQLAFGLEQVLPDTIRIDLPVWAVMHEDLRQNAACRAVFDALVAGLAGLA